MILIHTVYTLASLDAAGYMVSIMRAVSAVFLFHFSVFSSRLGLAQDKG